MSIVYNGEHSVDFYRIDGTFKNSWNDFHLIPSTRPYIVNPKANDDVINYILEHGDIRYYQYESIDNMTFGERNGQFEFYIDHEKWNSWAACYRELVNYFHGFKFGICLTDGDEDYIYPGRIIVQSYTPGTDYSKIVLQYIITPNPNENTGTLVVSGSYVDSGQYSNNKTYMKAKGSSCTAIYESGFYNCSNLIKASFPMCQTIGSHAFRKCSKLANVYIPNCANIGSSAFESCSSLTSIDLPRYSYQIYDYAFANCTSLSEISLYDCEVISPRVFYNCTKLENISIPKCRIIYELAFLNCYIIDSISLPKCQAIYSGAFSNCRNLSVIYLTNSNRVTLDNSNAFYGTRLYYGVGSIYVPSSLYWQYTDSNLSPNWSYYASRFVSI